MPRSLNPLGRQVKRVSHGGGLLVVGVPEETHVGAHFRRAAASLRTPVEFADARRAFDGPGWLRQFNWRVRGRRPSRLTEFNLALIRTLRDAAPRALLATGIAPVSAATLAAARTLGIVTMNFLTDDPWNPAHRAPWFMEALPEYDYVYTPRSANLGDLRSIRRGGPSVYVPFAYAPEVHFPEPTLTPREESGYDSDVMFAGGADEDRRQVLGAFVRAGFRVALYGGYWDRYTETRAAARGYLDAAGLRTTTAAAKVCLCLVRRANRDGHAMRSFEVPAMGGCVLAEDTPDHRRIFGPEGAAALYFQDIDDALAKARGLVNEPARRVQLAAAAHGVVTGGANTYADRLRSMLDAVSHVAA
jgi:spore maturation protein CgeB